MGVMASSTFQVKMNNNWSDYNDEEDKVLKRAFMAGCPSCKFQLRGQSYECDFKCMVQINIDTGKERQIRPPQEWPATKAPIAPGRTMVVNVPVGSPGTVIQVPHPQQPGKFLDVNIPANARPGQAVLVPLPPAADAVPDADKGKHDAADDVDKGDKVDADADADKTKTGSTLATVKRAKWTTGAKVSAVGAAGVVGAGAVVGGMVVAHAAEH